jgi:hypothetical protein
MHVLYQTGQAILTSSLTQISIIISPQQTVFWFDFNMSFLPLDSGAKGEKKILLVILVES